MLLFADSDFYSPYAILRNSTAAGDHEFVEGLAYNPNFAVVPWHTVKHKAVLSSALDDHVPIFGISKLISLITYNYD